MQAPALKAYTLVEALVGASLALLLGLMVMQVFVPGMRFSVRSQARAHLQESCYSSMRQIRMDLQETNASALGYLASRSSAAGVIGFQVLDPTLTEPLPAYTQEVRAFVYDPTARTLVRKRWKTVPGALGVTLQSNVATRFTGAQLLQLAGLAASESRLLASDVEEMTMTSAALAPNIGNPIRLRLACKTQVAAGAPDAYALEESLFLRNCP